MVDNIFALATARGRAGIGVVRLSGPDAHSIAEAIAGPDLPSAGRSLRLLRTEDGGVIDEALVLTFTEGASFTGDPVVEFQVHGSMAVVATLLRVLGEDARCRIAEPGEFSRRALENGRMDLSQIEGLGDLIEAETEAQRRQALRLMQGTLSDLVQDWRRDLIRAMALIEATIDFADEEVPTDVTPEVEALIKKTLGGLVDELEGFGAAERIRDGFEIAIVGRPNAGKSTLLNRLAGREAAITSSIAGTTRDVIEVRMDLRGLPVTFLDTAGLRETQDEIEVIGVRRAKERAEGADLRIFLLEPEQSEPDPGIEIRMGDVLVAGKADLGGQGISGLTGAGIPALLEEVTNTLSQRASGASSLVRERHRLAIERSKGALESALDQVRRGPDFAELAAEDLRGAVRILDAVLGKVDVEHVLDEVFASFCLGK
ncbi:MAG: tRNA uridine-5-carboxymethylaminomethyl(34) synthesis GTPase MnmE [Rubricella sp.]